jgi:hypothetical protein
MAEQTNTKDAYLSLPMFFKSRSELYDLHTHLLGMGNAGFWVDTILMDPKIMPTNTEFIDHETIRKNFCPLIWDKEGNTGFVDGTEAAEFFYYLYRKNILPVEEDNILPVEEDNILPVEEDNTLPRDENNTRSSKKKFSDVIEVLKKDFSTVLCELIDEKFNKELLHQGLCFKDNFSYDVVLTLSDLAKGLGIKKMDGIGFEQLAITEKLIGYLSPGQGIFQDYIYFNARKQKFEINCGIQVQKLRELITVDPDKPSEAKKLARAHIINAFSMCDAQGTPARLVDFHTFHGSFTPEFYPRRFALKDSIYGQRLDVLAALIEHIAERYQTSLPPVTYCEFSVGVSDLSSPWVFDVLRSIGTYLQTEITPTGEKDSAKHTFIASKEISSFSQIAHNDHHFPHLRNIFTKPKVNNTCKPRFTYKFLAGFGRQEVAYPLTKNQNDALRLLYNSPQRAILIMMEEIAKSKTEAKMSKTTSEQSHTTAEKASGPFGTLVDQLKKLERNGETMPSFYEWVVGLDLFGDELGYPYCPFVARPFIEYILHRRSEKAGKKRNERFGLRIHCGENVIFADDDSPTYRLFIAHMYIVFRCLRFLQCELESGIRIGHGIAFDRILGTKMSPSRHRKSSVLLAEMREHANYLFKNIAFEVNITSNEYLLGQTLRQGKFGEILRLDALFESKAKIILATDDDGIWPIDRCPFTHPGHHSLSAEYCRAISTSLIKTSEQLDNILKTTKDFCFWNNGGELQIIDKDCLLPDDKSINSIIIHPSIIKLIHEEYKDTSYPVYPALEKFKIYNGKDRISNDNINWKNPYGSMRVAFICACFKYDNDEQTEKETIQQEYRNLFEKAADESMSVEDEFDFIYDNWKKICSEFIFPDKKEGSLSKSPPYIEIIQKNKQQKDDVHDVVYSEPEPRNVTEGKPLHEIFIDFLQKFHGKKAWIRAFAQGMDIEKTVEAINRQVDNENYTGVYENVIVTIYTNPNKHKYTYRTINHRFKLQVNPKPSKRDYTNENFLYVLCPHASAATVAVHLISEQIFETHVYPPTTSSENNDANPISATEPYTSESGYKDGSEEKNVNEQLLQKPHEENSQKQNLKRPRLEEETKPENKRSLISSTSESQISKQ